MFATYLKYHKHTETIANCWTSTGSNPITLED